MQKLFQPKCPQSLCGETVLSRTLASIHVARGLALEIKDRGKFKPLLKEMWEENHEEQSTVEV